MRVRVHMIHASPSDGRSVSRVRAPAARATGCVHMRVRRYVSRYVGRTYRRCARACRRTYVRDGREDGPTKPMVYNRTDISPAVPSVPVLRSVRPSPPVRPSIVDRSAGRASCVGRSLGGARVGPRHVRARANERTDRAMNKRQMELQ